MRVRLGAKFAGFFMIFGVLLLVGMALLIQSFAEKTFMSRYTANLRIILKVLEGALDLTPEELIRYGEEQQKDERYEEIQRILNETKQAAKVEYLYIVYKAGEDSAIYLFEGALPGEDYMDDLGDLGEEVEDYKEDYQANLRKTFETGYAPESLDVTWSEEMGYLASAYIPLKDNEGSTIAVLGIDKNMTDIVNETEVWRSEFLMEVGASLVVILVLLILIVHFAVVSPVRSLEKGVEKMAGGELGVTVHNRSRDEIGDISRMFNRMSLNIENHIQEVEELNQGYDRFVPSQLFHLLGSSSVVDVRLGDQARSEIAIVSMQMNGFDEMSRKLPASSLFAFINQVLSESIPSVMENGGVIEYFAKAGFQALYTESAGDALDASVTVSQRMASAIKENRLGTDWPIKFTIGIAYGPVMMGIVGQERRMNNIFISEQTMVAEYLQEMGSRYGASILITGSAAKEIPNFEEIYHSRFVGFLKIRALDMTERIYDVFDGDEAEIRHMKTAAKHIFENGVRLYSAGLYSQARGAFVEVLKQFRRDSAAREYLFRCNQKEQDEAESGAVQYLEVL